tara:strand:+ start:952 stop:3561 length:2610 start_codon:yes stop_codon:yes gene_type:complete
MAKLTYTRRASGGSYKGRNIPDDKKATEAEQRVIKYLNETRQDTKQTRQEYLQSLGQVHSNEASNRQTLQTLESKVWQNKVNNIKKRQQTEVDYYEGLADQAGEREEFWRQFSPKLAEDLGKVTEGLIHTVQYARDKRELNKQKRQAEAEEDGRIERNEGLTPNQLQEKAFDTIIAESAKEQARFHDEGEFEAAAVTMEQTFGKSANTIFWGVHHGRKAVANFDQDFDAIVAMAFEGVDPSKHGEDLIEASYFRYLKHKGVALESIAGREVTKVFKKKLAALSANRLQQTLAARDEETGLEMQQDVRAAIKSGNGLEQAVTQFVLHDARSHKMIGGKYSAPAMRQINYGQTFDSLVEHLLKLHNWSSFQEFNDKILSLPIIPNKTNYHLPVDHPKIKERPTWRKQREHMISTYKDIFAQTYKTQVGKARDIEKVNIAKRIADLNVRITDKTREDFIDVQSKKGREELYSLLKSAESEDEKAWIGDKVSYDAKSHVSLITHEQMLRALNAGDATEFQWYFNNLKDHQKKYYEGLNQFISRQALLEANWTYKDTENHVETKVKSLLTKNWSIDSNFESYKKAKKWGIQRFYDINEAIDIKQFPNTKSRLDEVKRRLNEELSKEATGLFEVDKVGNRMEFIHFVDKYEYDEPGMYEERARTILDRFDQKTPTLDEVNQLDLIPEKDAINIMKDVVTGSDGVRLPKILWDVHKKTGLPLVDIVNGQLTRESISTTYNYKATEKDLLKATQVEYLEQKAPKEIANTTSRSNVPAVLAWYDVRNLLKTATDIGPQKVYQGTALNALNQFSELLPKNLQKYKKNLGNQSSLMDDVGVPYEIVEGRTRFSDPELAIRRGQVEGLVYNPWEDTMMEVA